MPDFFFYDNSNQLWLTIDMSTWLFKICPKYYLIYCIKDKVKTLTHAPPFSYPVPKSHQSYRLVCLILRFWHASTEPKGHTQFTFPVSYQGNIVCCYILQNVVHDLLLSICGWTSLLVSVYIRFILSDGQVRHGFSNSW